MPTGGSWLFAVLGLIAFGWQPVLGQSAPRLQEPPRLELVAQGYQRTQGTVVDRQGRVLFADGPSQRILRYHPRTRKVEIVREQSGGASGLAIDGLGRLVVCESVKRCLTRLDNDGLVVLAERYQDRRLNGPADLCIAGDGGIYFTDPWDDSLDPSDQEQDAEAVYHVSVDGRLQRVIENLRRPRGIALSPDGKTLYVADEINKRLVAYRVNADGSLRDPWLFAQWKADRPGGPQGIQVTAQGRVLVVGQSGLWIYEADGSPRMYCGLPESPTHLALADKLGKVVYVTAGRSLYRLRFQ